MTRNKVEICGVDTSKLPVLKNEEMRLLFKQMQEGDITAREKLVNGNLRLVLSVIQRFNNRGEFVDDLFQVGCLRMKDPHSRQGSWYFLPIHAQQMIGWRRAAAIWPLPQQRRHEPLALEPPDPISSRP